MRKSHKKTLKKWQSFLAGKDFNKKEAVARGKDFNNEDSSDDSHSEKATKAKVIIPEDMDTIKHSLSSNMMDIEKGDKQGSNDEIFLLGIIHKLLISFETEHESLADTLGLTESKNRLQMDEKYLKEVKILIPKSRKYGDYSTNVLLLLYANNQKGLFESGIQTVADFSEKISPFITRRFKQIASNIKVNIQKNGYIGLTLLRFNSVDEEEEQEQKGTEEQSAWCSMLKPLTRCQSSGNLEKHQKAVQKIDHYKSQFCVTKQASEKTPCRNRPTAKVNKDMFLEVIKEQQSNLDVRKFEIKMEKAKFERESFELFRKYSSIRHKGSKKDEETYTQFMCMQALEYSRLESGDQILYLGCYHFKYYLDNKLIAVSVVDILPTCFYSVYFFFDPEYEHLSLGVVSILKEIEYMQRMQKYFPNFQYYHLGGYVQTSWKMAYKADYEPAELLCPYTYQWVTLDEKLKRKINTREVKLSDESSEIPEDMNFEGIDIDAFVQENVKLDVRGAKTLSQLGDIKKYYTKVFKDITLGLGKELISKFEFGVQE